jgi:hypothetical protein
MAPMAIPAPADTRSLSGIQGSRRRQLQHAILWIVISMVGAVAGALTAFELRQVIGGGPPVLWKDLGYLAIVANVLMFSAAQWFLLQRFKVAADWWVPATVTANLVNAIVVIPTVLNLFGPSSGAAPVISTAISSGAVALAAAGLLIGAAQAWILRTSSGNVAWLWIAATVLGGALAGSVTTALSAQLFSLLPITTISLVAAAGALLTAACQAPVLVRIIR